MTQSLPVEIFLFFITFRYIFVWYWIFFLSGHYHFAFMVVTRNLICMLYMFLSRKCVFFFLDSLKILHLFESDTCRSWECNFPIQKQNNVEVSEVVLTLTMIYIKYSNFSPIFSAALGSHVTIYGQWTVGRSAMCQ